MLLIFNLYHFQISVYRVQHEYVTPTLGQSPTAPKRLRSRSRTSEPDDDRTSRGAESFVSEVPERSITELRDEMGYAIIDKSRQRDKPPRPPAPRRSRSRSLKSSKKSLNSDIKFFTTPRPLNDSTPSRPTRNYSTLGPSRPPRRKSPNAPTEIVDENKENIDLDQYIEIEDDIEEHSRLQSGEVISKMKSRPLPAPPRPPRKTRNEPLHDITLEENIMNGTDNLDKDTEKFPPASEEEAVEEIEVSTQTDPLPDDFICEEVLQEPTDKIVAPRRGRRRTLDSLSDTRSRSTDRPKTPIDGSVSPNVMIIERRVQTPTVDFDVDGTVTHASIVVKPVAEYPPESYVSQRFSADLPDIMPEILIPSSTYSDEDLQTEELLLVEKTFKADEQSQIEETIDECLPSKYTPSEDMAEDQWEKVIEQQRETVIPDDLPKDIFDDSEYNKNLLESTEDDLLPLSEEDIEEQPPAIPEKPLRMRMKQTSKEPSLEQPQTPIPPSSETTHPAIPPYAYQPQIIERIIERPVPFSVIPGPDAEVEVLKAAKLQVTDLDVERLTVGELQAHKILVSEIDGVSLQISELSSKTGSITVNGLEIPTGLIQEILDKLQPISQPPTVVEQVSTQTDIVEPELQEAPISEPVSTQTEVSITHIREIPLTEQASTQTDKSSEVVETQTEETQYEPKETPVTEQVSTQTYETQSRFKECPTTELCTALAGEIQSHIISEMTDQSDKQLLSEPEKESDEIMFQSVIQVASQETDPLFNLESNNIATDITELIEEQSEKHDKISEHFVTFESEKIKKDDSSVAEQSLKNDIPHCETQKVIKLVTETIDISESPLSFDMPTTQSNVGDVQTETSSEAKKKLSFDSEIVENPINDELVRDVIDDLLSGQISDLQKRIATLQEQMTLESMLDSEDELVPDEPLSEFDESLIPEIIDDKISPQTSVVEDCVQAESSSLSVNNDLDIINIEIDKSKNSTNEKKQIEIEEKIDVLQIVSTVEGGIPLQIESTSDQIQTQTDSSPNLGSYKNEEISNIESTIEISDYERTKTQKCENIPHLTPQENIIEEALTHETTAGTSPSTSKMQRTLSQPVAPSEVKNQNIMGSLAQSHVLQGLPFPVSYYSELVQSIPPSHTVHTPQQPNISEEDIPVHHKRRRPQRRLSRSSSEEEEPRSVPRHVRHTRSPEPSVPQLTGQLIKASAVSIKRTISHLLYCIPTEMFGTLEGKQDLQVALILILILIAGLILLGFGGNKTVHLHHWEYFNPPTDL